MFIQTLPGRNVLSQQNVKQLPAQNRTGGFSEGRISKKAGLDYGGLLVTFETFKIFDCFSMD